MILPGFPRTLPMVGGFNPNTPLGTFVDEQGGYYIGTIVDPDAGGETYALFLAAKAAGQGGFLAWKTSNTSSPGATSSTNGLANSSAINNSAHPAAFFCRGRTIGGFDDWYLPSSQELNVIYTHRTSVIGADSLDMDITYYWSSTESSSFGAFQQRFSDGAVGTGGKTDTRRVRAVRRLAL